MNPKRDRKTKPQSMNESIMKSVINFGNKITVNRKNQETETLNQKILHKTPSNGLDQSIISQSSRYFYKKELKSETSTSSIYTNRSIAKDGILEYKLLNARLVNENNILKEKNKTLKQIIQMKNDDYEIVRNKYNNLLEEYKVEVEKIKKINTEFKVLKENSIKRDDIVKSTISIFIELLEIYVSPCGNNNTKKSPSLSNSIDVYESMTIDVDEKRNNIIEQIQGLLVSKLIFFKKNFHIEIDEEIDRVKNWNINKEPKLSNSFSFSPNIFKHEYDSSILDISLSNINTSPKFRDNNSPEKSLFNTSMKDIKQKEYILEARSNFSFDLNDENGDVDDESKYTYTDYDTPTILSPNAFKINK